MSLDTASWAEILSILRQTQRIWSSGLPPDKHREFLALQMSHPWGRRHLRYWRWLHEDRLVASCKTYDLSIAARGSAYKIVGIGAVYTQTEHRGRGHAAVMLKALIDRYRAAGYDGALLYSEIGAEYYARLGFLEVDSADFFYFVDDATVAKHLSKVDGGIEKSFQTRETFFEHEHAGWTLRHYGRWLRGQRYGIWRSPGYWHFKLYREAYLSYHSLPGRAFLENLFNEDKGYALFEVGAGTLRVLEVIGDENARRVLWKRLIEIALERSCRRIRGWQSQLPDFLPATGLFQRAWGRPMFLPFHGEVENWVTADVCPLLELDHL